MVDSGRRVERRSEERPPVRSPGRIWFGKDYGLWADCVVRDLTTRGARLEISALYELPRRLIIAYRLSQEVRFGVVRWQRGALAGVSFEPSPPADALWSRDRIAREWHELIASSS